jgi:hypothetical protein
LSAKALAALGNIAREPAAYFTVNAGIIDRLCREDLVTIVNRPSPYPSSKSATMRYLEITQAGRDRLASEPTP